MLKALVEQAYNYVSDPDVWVAIGTALVRIILILIAARIAVAIITVAVNRIFTQRKGGKLQLEQRRIDTLRVLVNNVARYTIYFLAILLVLKELNFDLQPVLVSAGVLGLAVGFGAQSLVRDVITGFFIIFEDQFAVGDVVTINQLTGTVQEIGLRITKIKSWTGEVHIFPNGSINQVTNYSVQNSIAVVDVSVAYEEDLDYVQQVLREVAKKADQENDDIVKEPEVLGVQGFGASEVVIRVIAECKPMTHHAITRKLRAMIKEEFDSRGIEIPYPKMVHIQPGKQRAQG
ncbi:MAG: mechanosensitive ion channel family protein [Brevibacillus sp.]|nr:mechanosensitive ion channel family protein [Brevibacillus sp.]